MMPACKGEPLSPSDKRNGNLQGRKPASYRQKQASEDVNARQQDKRFKKSLEMNGKQCTR